MRILMGTMTTLLPERTTARRTHLVVEASAGRARLRSETLGDRSLPGLRPMQIDSGPGRVAVCLVPDGALLLAGDAVALDVQVGDGARLDLVEPAGTVAYNMRGGSASWEIRIDVADGGVLTWAGEPFVVADGARVRRTTTVRIGTDARLAVRETVVLGRHGERHGALDQRWTAIGADGGELLVEELCVDGTEHRPGVLGGHRVLGSVVALGVDVCPDRCRDGRLDLEHGGSVWRRLGIDAHGAVPEDAWRAVREVC